MTEPLPDLPFAVLGLEPTLDAAAVKRAYFAELARHPPHSDPRGFHRLRVAYEALQSAGALAQAFASAPLDLPAELARWNERFGSRLESAKQRAQAESEAAGRLQAFLDATSRMTLREAQAAYASDLPQR